MTDFHSMNAAQLADMARRIADARKAVKAQENARVADLLLPFVEDVVTSLDLERSAASDWAGYGMTGIPVTIDGTQYSVSVTITDVAVKATRTDAFKAAKDFADQNKIAGTERKEFIAEMLKQHDAPVSA